MYESAGLSPSSTEPFSAFVEETWMSDGGFGGGDVASSISMTALDDDDAGLFISRGGVVNSNSKEGFIRLIARGRRPSRA